MFFIISKKSAFGSPHYCGILVQRNLLRLGTLARRMQCVSCGFIAYQAICSGLVYSISLQKQPNNIWAFFSCHNVHIKFLDFQWDFQLSKFFLSFSHLQKNTIVIFQKKLVLVSSLPCASLFELQQHYQKFVKILEFLLFLICSNITKAVEELLSLFF